MQTTSTVADTAITSLHCEYDNLLKKYDVKPFEQKVTEIKQNISDLNSSHTEVNEWKRQKEQDATNTAANKKRNLTCALNRAKKKAESLYPHTKDAAEKAINSEYDGMLAELELNLRVLELALYEFKTVVFDQLSQSILSGIGPQDIQEKSKSSADRFTAALKAYQSMQEKIQQHPDKKSQLIDDYIARQKGCYDTYVAELEKESNQKRSAIDSHRVEERTRIAEEYYRRCGCQTPSEENEKFEKKLQELNILLDSAKKELETARKEKEKNVNEFLCQAKKQIDAMISFDGHELKGENVYVDDTAPIRATVGVALETIEVKGFLSKIYDTEYITVRSPIIIEAANSAVPQRIILKSKNESNDEYLDGIVAGLALKVMENYPVGALDITLVDTNHTESLKPITQAMQIRGQGYIKLLGQYYDNLSEANSYLDGYTNYLYNDLYRRLYTYGNNIHSAYLQDPQNVKYKLIIIRNSLRDATNLEVGSLLKKLNIDSRYGVCTIIVDDTTDEDTMRNNEALNSLQRGALTFTEDDGVWKDSSGRRVILSSVEGNIESYVREKCDRYVDILNDELRKASYEPYERIGFGEEEYSGTDRMVSIVIPVGIMDGQSKYELQFDCASPSNAETSVVSVAVMGATGTGKSSLLHSMVINGCMKYTPRDLVFWLFDFKGYQTSEIYESSNIPHIRFVQKSQVGQTNIINDLENLLLLVDDEIHRRNDLFLKAKKPGIERAKDIADYNAFVDKESSCDLPHLPRIIVALDEPNQVYNYYREYQKEITRIEGLYGKILTQSRSSGVHFISFVHSVSGGDYVGKYVANTQEQIVFRMAKNHNSTQQVKSINDGLDLEMEQIGVLQAGEVLVCSPRFSGQIKKAKICMPRAGMFNPYIKRIVENPRNSAYPVDMRVLGKTDFLGLKTPLESNKSKTQLDHMKDLAVIPWLQSRGFVSEVNAKMLIGENCYSMTPIYATFSSQDGGNLWAVGKDDQLSQSIMTSALIQARWREFDIRVFDLSERSSLALACRSMGNAVVRYPQDNRLDGLKSIYEVFQHRGNNYNDDNQPIFVIINDLNEVFGKVANSILFEASATSPPITISRSAEEYDFGGFDNSSCDNSPSPPVKVSDAITTLLSEGAKRSIFFAIATDRLGEWINPSIIQMSERVICSQVDDNQLRVLIADEYEVIECVQSLLGEMSTSTDTEKTRAVFISKRLTGKYAKIRPIVYQKEEEVINAVKGE